MKKRVFSFLLTLVLLLGLLPEGVLAMEPPSYEVWQQVNQWLTEGDRSLTVCGVEVTSSNFNDIFGDGGEGQPSAYLSFMVQGSTVKPTLTLSGLNVIEDEETPANNLDSIVKYEGSGTDHSDTWRFQNDVLYIVVGSDCDWYSRQTNIHVQNASLDLSGLYSGVKLTMDNGWADGLSVTNGDLHIHHIDLFVDGGDNGIGVNNGTLTVSGKNTVVTSHIGRFPSLVTSFESATPPALEDLVILEDGLEMVSPYGVNAQLNVFQEIYYSVDIKDAEGGSPSGNLVIKQPHKHTVDGEGVTFDHTLTGQEIDWGEGEKIYTFEVDGGNPEINSNIIELPRGSYRMESNITMPLYEEGAEPYSPYFLELSDGVNLCTNGYTLNLNGRDLFAVSNADLRLFGCGGLIRNNSGTVISGGGDLMLEDIHIVGSDSGDEAAIYSSGHVTLKDQAYISGAYGVYVTYLHQTGPLLTLDGMPEIVGPAADIYIHHDNAAQNTAPYIDATDYEGNDTFTVELALNEEDGLSMEDMLDAPIVKLGDSAGKFTLTNAGYTLAEQTVEGVKCLVLAKEEPHTHNVGGESILFAHELTVDEDGRLLSDGKSTKTTATGWNWSILPKDDEEPYTYYLGGSDQTLASKYEFQTRNDLSLCLNGKTLTRVAEFDIEPSDTVTVSDCAGGGQISRDTTTIWVRVSKVDGAYQYGELVLESGKIVNTSTNTEYFSPAINCDGYATLKGGQVSGPYAVEVDCDDSKEKERPALTLEGAPALEGRVADIVLDYSLDSEMTDPGAAVPLIDATGYTGEALTLTLRENSDAEYAVGSPVVKLGSTPANKFTLTNAGYTLAEKTVDGVKCLVLAKELPEILTISTVEELEAFRDSVNAGNNYKDKTVTLTKDLDLSGKYNVASGTSWTPIGVVAKPFSGTFEGGGHKIIGLYIDTTSDYQGLFGWVESGGTVKNLGVGGTVTGGSYTGGVVGQSRGRVTGCYNTATVTGITNVGGIAGSGGATNCYNEGVVSGENRVGGVVGYLGQSKSAKYCYNRGKVTATASNADVGGVAGRDDGMLTTCYYLDTSCHRGSLAFEATKEEFASGKVAWNLQRSQSEQVWGQRLSSGPQPYPLLTNSDKVYRVAFKADNKVFAAKYVNEGNRTVSAPKEAPTKEGYVFERWVIDEETGASYNPQLRVTEDVTVYAQFALPHTHPVCGESCAHQTTHGDETYTPLSQAFVDSIQTNPIYLEAGNYYLAEDVTVPAPISVKENANLCLNGHTITFKKSNLNLRALNDVTFNCADCQGGGGIVKTAEEKDTGTLIGGYERSVTNLYGGTFSGSRYAAHSDGKLTVDGATLKGTGEAILIKNGAEVVINSGLVQTDGSYDKDSYLATVRTMGTDASLTITGGTFKNTGKGSALELRSEATLSGGTFQGGEWGDLYMANSGGRVKVGEGLTGTITVAVSGASSITAEAPWEITTEADKDYSGLFTLPATNSYKKLKIEDTVDLITGKHIVWIVPSAHTHSWASAWTNNETHHWHECTADGCTVTQNSGKSGYAEHVYDNDQDTTCNTCGATRTVTPPDPGHTHSWAAAWSKNETHHWHECTADGCTVTENSAKNGYAEHSKAWVKTDAAQHWETCAACGWIGDKADHTWDAGVVTQEPTASAEGVKTYTCTTCQATRTEAVPKLTFAISGTVTDHTGSGIDAAVVKLIQGGRVIAAAQTDSDGNYSFTDVPAGLYNVAAEKDGVTKTVLVELTDENAAGNIQMPEGRKNSVVEVKGSSTPAVVAGGVDAVAEGQELTSGQSVTVKLTVEAEETPADKDDINSVISGRKDDVLYLDLSLNRIVDDGINPPVPQPIFDTEGKVLEIVVPYDFTGKKDVTVYRKHGDAPAAALAKAESGAEGTFRLTGSGADGKVYIYASKFSTYAIAYTAKNATPAPGPGGSHVSDWNPFEDVKAGDWFYDSVKYVYEQGVMVGVDSAHFAPHDDTSRAMAATILWQIAGSPEPQTELVYSDCAADSWYAKAVAWATEAGVVKGYGEGLFGPNDPITRQQLAVILYHHAGDPDTSGSLASFSDGDKAGAYARSALCWAVEWGILSGKGNGILDPRGKATRAEVAAMMMKYCQDKK